VFSTRLSHHHNTTTCSLTIRHRKRSTQRHRSFSYYNMRLYYLDYSSHIPKCSYLYYIFQDRINDRSITRLYTWPKTNFLNTIITFNTNIDSCKNYLYIFYILSSYRIFIYNHYLRYNVLLFLIFNFIILCNYIHQHCELRKYLYCKTNYCVSGFNKYL
jgi:hypothetical protein